MILKEIYDQLHNFDYDINLVRQIILSSQNATLIINLLTPIVLFYLFSDAIPDIYLYIWMFILISVSILRYILSLIIQKEIDKDTSKERIYFLLKVFVGFVAINGSLWGILSIVVIHLGNYEDIFIYVGSIFGIMAGAMATLVYIYHASFFFNYFIFLFLSIGFLFFGATSIHYAVYLIFFIFMIIVIPSSFKIFQHIHLSHRQKNEISKLNELLNVRIEDATNSLITKNNELVNSLKNFETVLDTTLEMIILVNDDGQIIDINQSGVLMMGYNNKDELIGNNIIRFILPSQINILKQTFKDSSESKELTFVKYDESYLYALVRSQQIIVDFKDIRMITILDLSKLKENEKILQQQSRLAQMGEMISMIAHQWRQPLGAISASSIDIKMKLQFDKFKLEDKTNQVECKEFVVQKIDNITQYVQTLTSTIDDFRNFFKPDKSIELVNINEPIQKALEIAQVSYSAKGIIIEVDYQCEDLVQIYPNEMMHVILNFLKNSEDNFREKKIVSPFIKISTRKEKNKYTITIEDNGGGIKKEILPRIFDPYFSTKNEKNGTGLGLYMSKLIIEDHHNGKLKAFNTKEGVSFSIELKNNKV